MTGGDTIAEGIAVRDIGKLTHAVAAQLVDHIQVVSEVMIERAIVMLLEIEKTVTEGAGATGLAAFLIGFSALGIGLHAWQARRRALIG